MGMIESGVNKAVHFTVRNGRWVGPLALTGCLIGGAILNALPADTLVNTPTPIPTPGQTGVGGGGEPLVTPTQRSSNQRICVGIDELPPGKQTMYSGVDELTRRINADPFAIGNRIVVLEHVGGDWEKFSRSGYKNKELVHHGDKVCADVPIK